MRISDWSSDVCSSDLLQRKCFAAVGVKPAIAVRRRALPWTAGLSLRTGWRKRTAWRYPRRSGMPRRSGQPAGTSWFAAHSSVQAEEPDRKRVVSGKSESVRVDLGGRGHIKNNRYEKVQVRIDTTQTKFVSTHQNKK